MNFAKNRTLFPKMPKLGTPSLKQCAFLNGKRVLFSSRKIYEAGPMSGGRRHCFARRQMITVGAVWNSPSNERSDVATPQAVSGLMDFRLRKWSTEGVKKHKLFEERSSEFLCFSLTCSIFTEIRAAGGLSLFRFFLP